MTKPASRSSQPDSSTSDLARLPGLRVATQLPEYLFHVGVGRLLTL